MMTMPYIAGNWKMNGLKSDLSLVLDIAQCAKESNIRVSLYPPTSLLHYFADGLSRDFAGDHILLGSQDCHHEKSGAYTGSVSARMIKDSGAIYTLVGHSERRQALGETCVIVAQKVERALEAGLVPVICIGETIEEKLSGATLRVLSHQLRDSLPESLNGAHFYVSYEPVWAIGTDHVALDEDIIAASRLIEAHLCARFGHEHHAKILYGGSVKGHNAQHVLGLDQIHGLLVGGASLSLETFKPIIKAAAFHLA